MTLTPDDLKRIKAYCEKATPGPWDSVGIFQGGNRVVVVHNDGKTVTIIAEGVEKNMDFIAAARTDLPRLLIELRAARKTLAELRQLRAENAQLRKELGRE